MIARDTLRNVILASIPALFAGHPQALLAQDDLTAPPRLIPGPTANATAPVNGDDASSQLTADTLESEHGPDEEIVVIARTNPWRLPDLGSEWRARELDQASDSRIEAEILPLWDPEAEQPVRDLFAVNTQMQRVGFIQIFKIRFGRR